MLGHGPHSKLEETEPCSGVGFKVLTEVFVSSEEERTKFWTEVIRNSNKARNRVAKRFDVGRKEAQYMVGDTVVFQMKTLSSKGKGVSQKLDLNWSKPMVIVKF